MTTEYIVQGSNTVQVNICCAIMRTLQFIFGLEINVFVFYDDDKRIEFLTNKLFNDDFTRYIKIINIDTDTFNAMNYCIDEMYGMYLNVAYINRSRDFDDTADAIMRYIRKNQNSVYELSIDDLVGEIKKYIATLPGKKE